MEVQADSLSIYPSVPVLLDWNSRSTSASLSQLDMNLSNASCLGKAAPPGPAYRCCGVRWIPGGGRTWLFLDTSPDCDSVCAADYALYQRFAAILCPFSCWFQQMCNHTMTWCYSVRTSIKRWSYGSMHCATNHWVLNSGPVCRARVKWPLLKV